MTRGEGRALVCGEKEVGTGVVLVMFEGCSREAREDRLMETDGRECMGNTKTYRTRSSRHGNAGRGGSASRGSRLLRRKQERSGSGDRRA